jgi:serine/threonine protein kinase
MSAVPVWNPKKEAYQLNEVIGEGAYGRVYKADIQNGSPIRILAIKEFRVPPTEKELKKVQTEVDILIKISSMNCHPNVICYLDHYQDGNNLYIVTEFIEGISFEEFISRHWFQDSHIRNRNNQNTGGNVWIKNVGFTLAYNVDRKYPNYLVVEGILEDLLRAVDHLHGYDLIHRDIKPANIMIKQPFTEPQAVLIDLGLSCIGSDCSESFGGTPLYMAPEKIIAEAVYNRKLPLSMLKLSDLFSVGASMYEYMIGQNFYPTNVGNIKELINLIENQYPNLNYKWYSDPLLQNIVSSLLLRKPFDRISATDALNAMENAYDSENSDNPDNSDNSDN